MNQALLQEPDQPVIPGDPSGLYRWIVAQEGSRQTYAVPLAFSRLNMLRLFYADIWCRHGRALMKNGPKGVRALAGRFKAEIPAELVVSFSPSAIISKVLQRSRRAKQSPTALADEYVRFGRWFARRVRDHLETVELDREKDVFFGFDTNSLEVLHSLKGRGVFTVLDQVDPGQMHEDMVIEEAQLWPDWQELPGRMPQSYWDRRKEEWRVADMVLVNSDWSRQALIQDGVPNEKIIVVPLAIDLSGSRRDEPVNPEGTLKVLWLGNVTLGKGIPYLVEAARLLRDEKIEFLLAGPLMISEKIVGTFPDNIKLLGWITRDKLSEIYRQAHMFVLPTISDGFAVTQLEAMAHGLPVVITPNCGRVVTDGVDGLIVPARDGRALADALARLVRDRQLVRDFSHNALRTIQSYDLPSNARMIARLTAENRKRFKPVAPVR